MIEAKSTDQEEAKELSFVPSAINVSQKLMFRCDNQCSENPFSFWQLASVVIQDGEESYTTIFCHKCYNEGGSGTSLWRTRRIVEAYGK